MGYRYMLSEGISYFTLYREILLAGRNVSGVGANASYLLLLSSASVARVWRYRNLIITILLLLLLSEKLPDLVSAKHSFKL